MILHLTRQQGKQFDIRMLHSDLGILSFFLVAKKILNTKLPIFVYLS